MLETDYLIIGAGASGMAFADSMLMESDSDMIIIDRYDKPGGHWNLAYPFVKLHQPAAYYGVSSRNLESEGFDEVGYNKGLRKLSSGPAILAYYDDLMQHDFLPGGRVKYFPLSTYLGDGKFKSIITGEIQEVKVRKKIVYANHMKSAVPASHTPGFEISPEVTFIPINNLPKITAPTPGYVIIGGGKTGVDACLWLLEHGVNPDDITWIKPRDSWYIDRRNMQPSPELLKYFLNDRVVQFEALAAATSIDDLFNRLEKGRAVIRIDKEVKPTMFRGATISQAELEALRRIKNVVRLGHVKSITSTETILDKGTIDNIPGQIFVDCSANALKHGKIVPVFNGNEITIQPVRGAQLVFSASFIAHVEVAYTDDDQKNEFCQVIPLPNTDLDWITMLAGTMHNQRIWRQDPEIAKWLYNSRLDGFSKLVADVPEDNEELQALLKRFKASIKPAAQKLEMFVKELS